MLKIKEERMQDLVNFGFKFYKMMGCYVNQKYEFATYSVDVYTQKLSIDVLCELDYELCLLYDMIKDGMVEKEGNE